MADEYDWMRSHVFLAAHPEFPRNTFYLLAKTGRIPTVKIGRRLFVRSDAMDVLAEQQLKEKQAVANS